MLLGMLSELKIGFFGATSTSVVIVTAESDGVRNAMAVASHLGLGSEPPSYGVLIGRQKATHPLIVQSGAFGVNFLPLQNAKQVHGTGVLSLHNGLDKFERLDLHALPDAPLALAEAYLHYTCRVTQVQPFGDHDLFVGKVVEVRYDPSSYDADGVFSGSTALHLGRGYYAGNTPERQRFPAEEFKSVNL